MLQDLKLAHVYIISCKDMRITDFYVGSTANFNERQRKHRNNSLRSLKTLYALIRANGGFDNWEMTSVNSFPFQDTIHLRTKESYWMNLLKPTINRNRAILSRDEKLQYWRDYQLGYYQRNKAKITQKSLQRYYDQKSLVKQ